MWGVVICLLDWFLGLGGCAGGGWAFAFGGALWFSVVALCGGFAFD